MTYRERLEKMVWREGDKGDPDDKEIVFDPGLWWVF